MDLKEIQTILETNTKDGTLKLPKGAFTGPIENLFRDYLLEKDLVIQRASIVPVGGQNITVVGQGASFPFENSYVTAVFTAPNQVAAVTVQADGFFDQTTVWRFSTAFPVLAKTFYKDLQFTAAVLTLRSANASVTQPGGLFFSGKQELAGKLAVLSKLLNGSNEVALAGAITIVGEKTADKAVPVMVLEDPSPGTAFGMQFLFQLIDEPRIVKPREGQPGGDKTVPAPQMQFVSRITVDAQAGKETLDISTHFTPALGLLTFQADMDRLPEVGMAALNSLARGANLGTILPAQLPLVNQFKLGQWSMSVIPDEPRITSISIGAGIAEPWTVIPGLFTLDAIDFAFTINHIGEKWEPTAALAANVSILDGPEQFTIVIDAQYPSYIITGSLEETEEGKSIIDLVALTKRFLGETVANSLPCKELKVVLLTLLLDPKNSTFTFETVIKSECSLNLGVVTFTLTQVEFNFSYVAGETTGSFAAAFWLLPPSQHIATEEWFIDEPPEGAIAMEVSAAYNGEEDGWSFRGGLAPDGKIDLKALIGRYLPLSYQDFVPNVVINKLEAGFETGATKAYDFAIGAEWTIETLNTKIGALVKISSAIEDGVRKDEGEIQGFVRFGGNGDEGGLELKVTATFNDSSKVYKVEFLGWTATLSSKATEKTLTFEAGDKSLGEMIEVLINAVIPGADLKLAAPWSVLNSIPLKSFKFVVKFDEDSSPKSAGLTYSPNINIGFAQIDDIALDYDVETEKVMFRITKGRFLQETIGPENPVEWDVADPESTKPVPGEGSELFRLDFLGMGQHMAVAKSGALVPVPASIFPAVTQLKNAFADEEELTLVFNEATNWLIAARFTVVQAVDIGIVFYDPELYGLVISVNGSKAADKLPVFKGLIFEILYKKISDTVGMWQIDFTLPEYVRNLQFGAVSVTLPSMKLQIYTNGDFMVDLGFPANDDYSRSFSVQALPFVGSGGLYFGVLSSETSDKVPQTTKGNFSPVIAFGIGLRVGMGKDLNYGVFKAGVSVTLQGVLEGILAWYNPYPAPRSLSSASDPQMISGGSLQSIGPRTGSRQLAASANRDDFYYMIQARVALVGKLYGSVDLGIISANLDVEVRVGMRLTLEAYRPIEIFFEVNVSVTLSVKINLGLFKISIDLSFKIGLSFAFTIGDTNQVGPWASSALLQTSMLRQATFMQKLDAPIDSQCPVIPPMKWQTLLNSDPVKVPLLFVPQFTAGTGGALGTGLPRTPYVVAMTYVSSTPPKEPLGAPAPFDELARGALLWTLNAYLNHNKENTTVDELLKQDISIVQLKEIFCYLTQKNLLEPFTVNQVVDFLKNFYRFKLTIPPVIPAASAVAHDPDEAVSIFPIMPLLKLETSTGVEVDFLTKTPSSDTYLASVKKYFEEMAVRYKTASERASLQSVRASAEETDQSLASFIFLDFFALLARSTIQDAINLLQAQQAPLEADESLADFVRNHPELAIDVPSLALANATRPLRASIRLHVPGVVYTAKQGDTAESVASKLKLDVAGLLKANAVMNGEPLEPATAVKLPAVTFTTSSTAPESLLDITRRYGVSLTELALANQDLAELFPAGEPLLAPHAQQQNIGNLAEALQTKGSFNNLSGLAARVLLQGLRPLLPNESPQGGMTAPLYELTGQQFDGSGLVVDSTITLSVPEDAKEWFQLGQDRADLTYIFTEHTAEMLAALKAAQFGPAVTFKPAKLLRIEPRRFTLPTSVQWHTPVTLLTANRGDDLPADTIEPQLWQFPSELLQIITGDHGLQPKVELWTQRQEGPGQKHPKEPVTNYTWSTVIDIKVRQTASGDNVFLPNTYELTGIDAGGTQLLENLIVWYAKPGIPVIDKILILYPPNPAVAGQDAPPTGLTSDPDPTFFLLQTNLSTASQPPQVTGPALLKAAVPKHDPLGQTELEFLKLLWESSIVNSGGYVLSYEAQPKKGLPDYLFSQDGVASLTLLITYNITDNVLQNFLNNVVICQVIDTEHEVLYASPVSQTVSNFKLSPDQTLADVAARYRVTVSQLATQNKNAHAKIASGKHLRIPPVTRRIRAGELLETIAARSGFTPEAVAALNPGVDISITRFLRLPERVWRAEHADSLASLAERFGTTVATLAHANKNVPGLIQDELTFNDRLEEAIATIPPGNVAFYFTRPHAVSPNIGIDGKQQLSELYNLLAYRIKQGEGFNATNSALPVSPDTPEGTTDWIYDSVVPVSPFENQAFENQLSEANDNAPDPKQDPYNGVGKTVQVNFNWQDLFGNWIDSEVHDQSWPDQGFSVGYIDNLIALDQWPSVTSDYVIAPGDRSAQLSITLRFNPAAYLPAHLPADTEPDSNATGDMALSDLGKFKLIYYQLTQDDVRVTVSSTMQAENQSAEAASPQDVLIQFVLEIIKFLTPISEGQPALPAPADVAMSQPVTDGNQSNLFALRVALEISRNLDLVNEEFKDIPAVASVTSRVPANAGQKKVTAEQVDAIPPLSLEEFARKLETAFPTLKVMVAAPKKSLGETEEEIWIARFASTESGIAFTIDGSKPLFYSVEPLARNLLSRPDVLVYQYQSGKYIATETPIITSQNSVDLDQLGRNFLAAVEQVLGPQFSAATWKLEYGSDTSTPVDDPPNPQTSPYEAIVAAKELLATAISTHVANVLDIATPSDAVADARESLRQQLLVDLTSAYTVDVIMQYPVKVSHSKYSRDDRLAPRLFGKPVAQNPNNPNAVEKKDAFSFSTSKFSLAKRETGTYLTFSFDTNREQQGKDTFDDVFEINLFHQINALEHRIHPVDGIEGYQASSWLTFVLPDSFDTPGERKLLISLGDQTIPVPLRAYPTPPSLNEQTFIPHVKQFVGGSDSLRAAGEDKLREARLWNYRCQYEYVGAAHDKILASVKLNVPPDKALKARFSDATNPDLFAALVQFTNAYPDIAKDLDQYLATGTNNETAFNAIRSFAWLVQRTANAWKVWQNARTLYHAALQESAEYHFVIVQQAEDVDGVPALVVSVKGDGSSMLLPQLPQVEIDGFTTKPKSQAGDSASYYFVTEPDQKPLTYDAGRNISSRQLVFKDFDILKIENAWAGAAVKRNENLLPNKITNPNFVFQSPVVRFANVLTPLLDPGEDIDVAVYSDTPAPLSKFLSNFLIAFFEGAQTASNNDRTIRLAAAYSYGLQDSGDGDGTSSQGPDLDITIPILLTTPTPISILKENLAPDRPFVKDVSDTINTWFLNKPSGMDQSGRLCFDLSVYSSLSESQLPVLRMRRLCLATKLLSI
jgi:LysM domain